MATFDAPLSVPNITLAVARQAGGGDPVPGFTAESGFSLSEDVDGNLVVSDSQSRLGSRPFQAAPDFFTKHDEYGTTDETSITEGTVFDTVTPTADWRIRTPESFLRYPSEPAVLQADGEGWIGAPIGPMSRSAGADPDYLYGRWWKKYNHGVYETENNAAHKFCRIWNGGENDLRVTFAPRTLYAANLGVTTGSASETLLSPVWSGVETEWLLLEVEVDYATNTIRAWVNGSEVASVTHTGIIAKTANALEFRHISSWDTSAGTAAFSEQTHWSSDIYADRSPARILLGDYTSWASRLSSGSTTLIKEEIQTPIEWSAGQVKFAPELRALTQYSGNSLYVITPSGSALKVGTWN